MNIFALPKPAVVSSLLAILADLFMTCWVACRGLLLALLLLLVSFLLVLALLFAFVPCFCVDVATLAELANTLAGFVE